jgi:hypothetical protein
MAASKSIWQNKHAPYSVKIDRIECDFPAATAERLRKAWQLLLTDVRPQAAVRSNAAVQLVHDLPYMELALERSNRVPLRGDLPYPAPGKKTKAVDSLFQLLDAYCEGKHPGRAKLLVQIQHEIAIVLNEKA